MWHNFLEHFEWKVVKAKIKIWHCGASNCTDRSDADNGRNKTYHRLPAESQGEIRKKMVS